MKYSFKNCQIHLIKLKTHEQFSFNEIDSYDAALPTAIRYSPQAKY